MPAERERSFGMVTRQCDTGDDGNGLLTEFGFTFFDTVLEDASGEAGRFSLAFSETVLEDAS